MTAIFLALTVIVVASKRNGMEATTTKATSRRIKSCFGLYETSGYRFFVPIKVVRSANSLLCPFATYAK